MKYKKKQGWNKFPQKTQREDKVHGLLRNKLLNGAGDTFLFYDSPRVCLVLGFEGLPEKKNNDTISDKGTALDSYYNSMWISLS